MNSGDNSLNFLLRIWTAKELGNLQALRSDLYFSIFESFLDRGIEMPFPQRDLHLRSVDMSVISSFSRASLFSEPVSVKRKSTNGAFLPMAGARENDR